MNWGIEITEFDQEVLEIYGAVRNQAIMAGMSGIPVDVDFRAVEFIMNLYEVENQREVFERVVNLWRKVAEIARKKNAGN